MLIIIIFLLHLTAEAQHDIFNEYPIDLLFKQRYEAGAEKIYYLPTIPVFLLTSCLQITVKVVWNNEIKNNYDYWHLDKLYFK